MVSWKFGKAALSYAGKKADINLLVKSTTVDKVFVKLATGSVVDIHDICFCSQKYI